MSHDRGCFVCFDDLPPRRLGCGLRECPYTPATEEEIKAAVKRMWVRRDEWEAKKKLKAERAMG